LFIFSCGTKTQPTLNNKKPEIDKSIYFHQMISRMNTVALPYKHNLSKDKEITGSFKYDISGYDTLFLYSTEQQVIGMLPDTSHFFGILYFVAGDDLIPSLVTFDHKGNRIDNQMIATLSCPPTPCELYLCNLKVTLTEQLNIYNYHDHHLGA